MADEPSQSDKFQAVAGGLEADEDEMRWVEWLEGGAA
jgi:hypothetical protein